jgi:cytochrome c-type biogenesis protein
VVPSITFPLAFSAGLLSFVSPCVLPLVPVYLGYLSGSSLSGDAPPSRRLVFGHALLFVGGFTLTAHDHPGQRPARL